MKRQPHLLAPIFLPIVSGRYPHLDGTLGDIADLSDDPRVVRFVYTVRADGRRTSAVCWAFARVATKWLNGIGNGIMEDRPEE